MYETGALSKDLYQTYASQLAIAESNLRTAQNLQAVSEPEEPLISSEYNMQIALSGMNSAKVQKDALADGGPLYESLSVEKKQAESAVKRAQYNLEKTAILAPFSGTLLSEKISTDTLVQTGTELFILADMTELVVLASIDEKYSTRIAQQQEVILYMDNTQLPYQGYVKKIAPVVDAQNGTLDLVIGFDITPNRLKFNAAVIIDIITDTVKDQITLDKLYLDPSGDSVTVLEDSKKMERLVKIGYDLGDQVIIEEGLAEGDILVLPE